MLVHAKSYLGKWQCCQSSHAIYEYLCVSKQNEAEAKNVNSILLVAEILRSSVRQITATFIRSTKHESRIIFAKRFAIITIKYQSTR